MYIQTIGTRHVNSTYSKRITSHIPTSLLVGSLPLAHNAEHFTSNSDDAYESISYHILYTLRQSHTLPWSEYTCVTVKLISLTGVAVLP